MHDRRTILQPAEACRCARCARQAGWRSSGACPLAPSFPPASPTCFRLSNDSKKSPSSSSAMLLAQLSRGEKGPCMAVSFMRVVPAQVPWRQFLVAAVSVSKGGEEELLPHAFWKDASMLCGCRTAGYTE